ncbi:MAG TPA: glutamate racemase, partial [Anaerolineae bacterium]|nr:glutamate racemase [Anaerolineae bacterium]
NDPRPIGIFDSGVGGLSVWREITEQLPHEDTIYFGDQIHIPYGSRSMEQIRSFSDAMTRFLLDRGCKIIVVACNTASAAALTHLRSTFPEISFVGMEPAVKPAAETTRTGVVGVLATPATFQGALFASVVERFAGDVKLVKETCPGLVQQVEAGELNTPKTRKMLTGFLKPILDTNADTIVLACTHYPFVIDAIRSIAPGINVIDPAPAIARQTDRVLKERGLGADRDRAGQYQFFSSETIEKFRAILKVLVDVEDNAYQAIWHVDAQPIRLTAML